MKTRRIVFIISATAFLMLIVALFLVSALRDVFGNRIEEDDSDVRPTKKPGGSSLAPRLP